MPASATVSVDHVSQARITPEDDSVDRTTLLRLSEQTLLAALATLPAASG